MKKQYFYLMPLLLAILTSCNRNNNFLVLGNFKDAIVASLEEALNMKGNSYFASENMQSGELFKIVDSNASYYENGKKHPFFAEVEKSKLIVINVGLYDVLPSMEINEEENILNYDNNLIDKQLEVFSYHMHHIVEDIRSINSKTSIFVLSSYNSFNFESPEEKMFNSIIKRINESILDSIEDVANIKYISIVDIKEQTKDNNSTIEEELVNVIRGHYNE